MSNDAMTDVRKEIGLYIHIPFCKSKCLYCDFNSYAARDELIYPYFKALKLELEHYLKRLANCCIKTVFIGGGTPSYVPAELILDIMMMCRRQLNIDEHAEISIECNPGTLDFAKLCSYRRVGINRVSIGLQAWQDHLLKEIGRIHNAGQFVENIIFAKNAGFNNINADLIFGLPGQTMEDWSQTLSHIVEQEISHISCYSLKVEEGTPLCRKLDLGELTPIDDELDREMYHLAVGFLKGNGFKHYEISNFAKPGHECRHNMIYWKAEEYLGLGAGAHSYLDGRRFNNAASPEGYIRSADKGDFPVENIEVIGNKESIFEYIMLGLRLTDGIEFVEFSSRYSSDIRRLFPEQLKRLEQRRLIIIDNSGLRLSAEGLDLANQVFMEFM